MGEMHENPAHVRILEDWMKSYQPTELFDSNGRLRPELAELAPQGSRRMSANPHTNGGLLLRELRLPNFHDYAVDVTAPGAVTAEATREMGRFLRDIMKLNMDSRNFRLFSPDESNSNRWQDVLEVTNRAWVAETEPWDDHLAPDGRVMEMLSEHQCQGWLEGYLLTGRHGFFSCYEAFIHIIDSMFNQHAKWLKVCNHIPWRRPIGSLNYLLSSHVWRQDHNGFSHQDPGFIDHVLNKKAEVVRVYLPPDANCLLSVTDHCLRSRNYVNVVVAGKQPAPQWLTMDEAVKHCTSGLGIWEWASSDHGAEPDVVMACCGDVPTLETLAAVDLLRKHAPELKVRVINVVDLMKLQPASEHPHGLSDPEFDALFTVDKPIIFAFHGYPYLIHWMTYRRNGHHNIHVRGYKEEGTTTTPFDMVMLNDLDRFHLVAPVRIDDEVERRLRALTDLAPLHQPKSLAGIDALRKLLPDVPAVACFDTAFHATLPDIASTYAIPAEWQERYGIRRYGFHGLSHGYASRRCAELTGARRIVVAHLGAGASLCAVLDGRSVDTTMGFTPLEGLVMATRSGSLDPGLVLWLSTDAGIPAAELADALEHRSGLLGLAGTADMRQVIARDDSAARLALGVYIRRLCQEIAAMTVSLGGLDALVFTGGVGEHAPEVRRRAVDGLGFLGLRLSDERNGAVEGDCVIDMSESLETMKQEPRIAVVTAREDLEIARGTRLSLGPPRP